MIPINRIAAALKRRHKHVSAIREIASAFYAPGSQFPSLERYESYLGASIPALRKYQHKRRTPKSKRVAGRIRPRW